MEIERKFLIKKEKLPENLSQYPCLHIEQGYLCTDPVVRIRRQNDEYYLTYKSKGLLSREEYNLPLTEESYYHLKEKADGIVICKDRYVIPEKDGLSIELDIFHEAYEGLLLAEVEFSSEEKAKSYVPPAWFGEDVTFSSKYHNSTARSFSPVLRVPLPQPYPLTFPDSLKFLYPPDVSLNGEDTRYFLPVL